MIILIRAFACLAIFLLPACSAFKSSSTPAQCGPSEPTACPVCAQQESTCPEPQIVEKVVEVPAKLPPMATTAGKMHLPIIGAVEWANVEPANIKMEARIDTGAETTSIHAEDIQLVEKDGKRYVRFSLIDPASGAKIQQEERFRRRVLIKQAEDEADRRFVVKLWITLGGVRSRVDVNLSDREFLDYPLLVGRNFLVDALIVDVSRHHLMAK